MNKIAITQFCKMIKNEDLRNRSLEKIEDIVNTVIEVYEKPFTRRLIHGLKDLSEENKVRVTALHIRIAYRIQYYFHNEKKETQKQYDDFQSSLCEQFLDDYNEILSTIKTSIVYGHAQKLINMTFKYLYCFSDASNYEAKFQHCHMPIDSLILKAAKDFDNISEIKYYQGEKSLSASFRGQTWSNLSKKNYFDLIKLIRAGMKKSPQKEMNNLLDREFVWWETIKSGLSGTPQ